MTPTSAQGDSHDDHPHHPIAVIGAGLGGLMLARVLHVKGVEAAVYDLDASPTARPQGGMLDMHEESGQAALRAAGLYDAFRAIIHAGGEATRIIDKDGTLLREDSGEDGQRPEVSRGALRDVLLGSLPEGTVRWGAKATAVRTLAGGRHEVTLADGSTFTADLLIGADGAWSRVRPLLTDATPAYAGLSFVEMHLADADTRHPKGAGVVGGGLLFALADRKGFLGHRDPDGSLHVYAALRTPADWAVSGPSTSPTRRRRSGACWSTSRAGTTACAPWLPRRTARSSPGRSTRCRSACAGTVSPGSRSSGTPPT